MKMTTLPYWGQITASIAKEAVMLWITQVDKTNQPLLYRLDTHHERPSLSTHALPVTMQNLCTLPNDDVLMVGADGILYQSNWQGANPKAIDINCHTLMGKTAFAVAMCAFGNKVAVLYPHALLIFTHQKKTALWQMLVLDEPATCLSVSADGAYLVIGSKMGYVTSYQLTDDTITLSSQEKLHQGDVMAVCFEPTGYQFFSSGADKQLYRTHAQGRLQAIDRAKASQHSQLVRALCVSKDKLYTGSDDQSVKSWQFDKGQPNTCKDDLVKIRQLHRIDYQGEVCLLAVGTDQSLRLIALDNDGKLQNVILIIKDGYEQLKQVLQDNDDSRFKEILTLLDGHQDNKVLELIFEHLNKTKNKLTQHDVPLAKWLASTAPKISKAIDYLERLLVQAQSEQVSLIAFERLAELSELGTLDKKNAYLHIALTSKYKNTKVCAIAGIGALIQANDEQKHYLIHTLQNALNDISMQVRRHALAWLEMAYDKDNPKADLLALDANKTDIRQAGLIRLYQRGLFDKIEVRRQITQLQNADDEILRKTAFYIHVLTKPKLAAALKAHDGNFLHIVQDFDDFVLLFDGEIEQKPKSNGISLAFVPDIDTTFDVAKHIKKAQKNKQSTTLPSLDNDSLEPLLAGLGSCYADISFCSAYSLALLKDERALGVFMQLVGDKDPMIRTGIAKALGELGLADGQALLAVLLNDDDANVRLIAMQSYGQLSTSALTWAKAGFESTKQDIHQLALAVLLTQTAQGKPMSDETVSLLVQALNNPFEAVRQEVIKVLINRVVQDDLPRAIALLTQSQSPDVHKMALTEWQNALQACQEKQNDKDGFILKTLIQFLDNPFAIVREQAFGIAEQNHKRISTFTLVELALASVHTDIKQKALNVIKNQKSVKLLPLVAVLFADEHQNLRQSALALALEFIPNIKLDVLYQGLASPYEDIQLLTAQALAKSGTANDKKTSLAIFENFLTTNPPSDPQALTQYKHNIEQALIGLAYLGCGFTWFERYLNDVNYDFSSAARHLFNVIDNDANTQARQFETLIKWQTDTRQTVANGANLALAVWGDERGKPLLNQKISNDILTIQWLQARNGLGIDKALVLQPMFKKQVGLLAYVMLAFYDVLKNPNKPQRLLESLAIAPTELATFGAGMVARYSTPLFWDYMAEYINQTINHDRADSRPKTEKLWALDSGILQHLAGMMVLSSPVHKAQAVTILYHLFEKHSFEHWLTKYQSLSGISAPTIPSLHTTHTLMTWQATAFGVWLGVIGQVDYYTLNHALSAIEELKRLALQHPQWADSVCRALLPLLHHDFGNVRQLVYRVLETLGLSQAKLNESAMNSPYEDMAKLGLKNWLSTFDEKTAIDRLGDLLQTSSEFLAWQACEQLTHRIGQYQASCLALSAYLPSVRIQAVNTWQDTKDGKTHEFLYLAKQNDNWLVRRCAWLRQLAYDKAEQKIVDDTDIAYAIRLLRTADYNDQMSILTALVKHLRYAHQQGLVHDEQILSLIQLLDTTDKRSLEQIYEQLSQLYIPSLGKALLEQFGEQTLHEHYLYRVIYCLSGFDQPIYHYEDELVDKYWLDEQHPRDVSLFICLSKWALDKANYERFGEYCHSLAWIDDKAHNHAIDALLYQALLQIPSNKVDKIVVAMAYRAKKRQGDLMGLKKALGYKEPMVQFLAAEGLASVGNKDGFGILMASMDYHSDGDVRRRAVLSLGELADIQAFEKLLKLAEDSNHYLSDVACEAIAHLGQHDQDKRILDMIIGYLNNSSDYNPSAKFWLNGLRWLNTPTSWQAVYDYIKRDDVFDGQAHAVSLLKHYDNANTRTFILELMQKSEDIEIWHMALEVARQLFGCAKDNVYAYDWAVLKSIWPRYDNGQNLERVVKYASLDELIDFVATYPTHIANHVWAYYDDDYIHESQAVLTALTQAILMYELDDKLVLQLLNDTNLQQIALQYLSKCQTVSVAVQKSLLTTLEQTQTHWQVLLESITQRPSDIDSDNQHKQRQNLSRTMELVVWILVYHAKDNKADVAIVEKLLAYLLAQNTLFINQAFDVIANDHSHWLTQALLAIMARLDRLPLPKSWQQLLINVPYWTTPNLAQYANLLTQKDATQDNPTERLLAWVQASDEQSLFMQASDSKEQESLRMSAIEALGQLTHLDTVEQRLIQLKQDPDIDIQRCAFRALRRYQRQRQKLGLAG